MAKIKTSKKQTMDSKNGNSSTTKSIVFKEYDPLKNLLNKEHIAAALIECIEDNDPEGFVEVIIAHLEAYSSAHALEGEHALSSHFNKYKNPAVKALTNIFQVRSELLAKK